MKAINRFASIVLPYVDDTTLAVTTTSKYAKPLIEVLGADLFYTIKNTHDETLEIHPNMEWPSGSEIEVSLDSETHNYIVAENLESYAPGAYLYSNNLLASADVYLDLLKVGMISRQEKDILLKVEANSPKLFEAMYQIGIGGLTEFRYDNTGPIKKMTVLKVFRWAVQTLFMYGLESLLALYTLDIGPDKEWYLGTRIEGTRSDAAVTSSLLDLDNELRALRASIQAAKLNADILQSLAQHIDLKLPQYKIAETAVLIILAIRYTDNGELTY